MITAFRRYIDTWPVKVFFVVMVGSFLFWGVGDVVRLIGTSTWVVKVAGQTIEGPAFQAEFQRGMAQATSNLPAGQEATPALKRQVGDKALERVVGEAAFNELLRQMHVVVPDAAVVSYVRTLPAFKGKDGNFDRFQFESVLRNNGLNEPRFLQSVRNGLAEQQMLGALAAGAVSSSIGTAAIYAGLFEKRSADMVEFLFYNVPKAADPDDAVLRRWYANHPDSYSTPETRRIKAVVLSPSSVATEITITEDDLQTAYERAKATYMTPAKRSMQILTADDEATARTLIEMWEKAPADWAAMEAGAKTVKGAASVDFTDATIGELPDPGLAQAAFSAETGKITGPVKGNWNWYVIRIVSATPGTEKSFDEVKPLLRDRVVADKATDLIYPRANTLDNLLANGNTLDNLPGDLGLIAVSGTMDAQGKTLEGEPAPLPGPDELRKALVDAAFLIRPGDPLHLTEAQTPMGPAYYAMAVEEITPPTLKPFESVQARVLEDWHFDQQRHIQNQAAAAMMAAINDGRSFTDAATIAGVTPRLTPQVTRGQSVQGMPIELHRVLFGLKKGEATMVETAEGFIVAIAAEIIEPDSRADEAGFTKTRRDVGIGIARDVAAVFQQAIRLRSNPQINRTNFDQIVQPQ